MVYTIIQDLFLFKLKQLFQLGHFKICEDGINISIGDHMLSDILSELEVNKCYVKHN